MSRLVLLIIFSLNGFASPWINTEDHFIKFAIEKINIECKNKYVHVTSFPLSTIDIINDINEINSNKKISDSCKLSITKLENLIKDNNRNRIIFELQTKPSNLFLQRNDKRYYKDGLLRTNFRSTTKNTFTNINFIWDEHEKKFIFDDSFVAIKKNNHIIKIGSTARWWSHSDDTSLILSNSARPIPGISISNFESIKIDDGILKLFNKFNYEIFLNRLESDRHIPNALLFGNRFSFSPHDRFNISLIRVAQFGGKGRPTDIETIKNMILGKDNANSKVLSVDTPGNQIAGIDGSILLNKKKNILFFFQYLGEDGLDPIIDDNIFGAIFPSKRFGHYGLTSSFKLKDLPIKISVEDLSTDTGFPNVTYNHSIYRSGYRYIGRPIGANIDADSDRTIFSLKTQLSDNDILKIIYTKSDVNKNNNTLNYLSNDNIDFDETYIQYIKAKNKYEYSLNISYLNERTPKQNNLIVFLNIRYKF